MAKLKQEYENVRITVNTPSSGRIEIDTAKVNLETLSKIEAFDFLFEKAHQAFDKAHEIVDKVDNFLDKAEDVVDKVENFVANPSEIFNPANRLTIRINRPGLRP